MKVNKIGFSWRWWKGECVVGAGVSELGGHRGDGNGHFGFDFFGSDLSKMYQT